MTLPAASPVTPRRRSNPNWGSGKFMEVGRALPTEFEMQVRELRLTVETYVASFELRVWCERNRNRFYIPEWLLEAAGSVGHPRKYRLRHRRLTSRELSFGEST